MRAIDLLQWWNLIFDLPFVAALIPLLLQATGAAHFGHSGHGVHAGLHGHHVHLPHIGHPHAGSANAHGAPAAPAVHGPAVPGHPQAGHPAATHHSEGPGPLSRALAVLGIGKVPIMMVFSSFSFIWGFSGLVANQLLARTLALPELFILPSIGIALVSSILLTSALSQGISKVMPSLETYTTSRVEFVGKTGHALYEINRKSGAAVVLDNESNRVQIKCCTEQDGPVIPRGHSLSVSHYDEQQDLYVVREVSLTDGEQAQLAAFEKKLKLKN